MFFYELRSTHTFIEELSCNYALFNNTSIKNKLSAPTIRTENIESNSKLNLFLNAQNKLSLKSQNSEINSKSIIINADDLLNISSNDITVSTTNSIDVNANTIKISSPSAITISSDDILIDSLTGSINLNSNNLTLNSPVTFANNDITYSGTLNTVNATLTVATTNTPITLGYSVQQGLITIYNVQQLGPFEPGNFVTFTVPVGGKILPLSYQPQYCYVAIPITAYPLFSTVVISITGTSTEITITIQASDLAENFYIPVIAISYIYAKVV